MALLRAVSPDHQRDPKCPLAHSLTLAATLLLGVALAGHAAASAATPPAPSITRENEIKAAALYNIIVFTDWPPTAFADAKSPLVIGVLGRGPIADLLKDLVENEQWHGRRVTLESYASPAQVKDCHVLFIGRSEHEGWSALRGQWARRPVLTVSDAPDFARRGGIVQLGIEHNRLKLTVNLAAARIGGLTISSKVLRLSDVVGETGQ